MLYSDGVYEFQRNEKKNDKNNYYNIALSEGANGLVDYAFTKGSSDNITVIVVKI